VKSVKIGWVSGQHGRYKKLIQIIICKTARKRYFWSLGFRIGLMLETFFVKMGYILCQCQLHFGLYNNWRNILTSSGGVEHQVGLCLVELVTNIYRATEQFYRH
jgi:hypothetical protein